MKAKICTIVGMAITACALFAASSPDGARWWSYVEFFASDKLEGRNTGSEGHRKAAEYVAAQFERDGLKPAGEQGYIQPVKFQTLQLDESQSSLIAGTQRRRTSDGARRRRDHRDARRPRAVGQAELVFVGYGLRAPESNYDDFAGLDTKGQIAVYIERRPASIPGALAAHYQSAGQRWKTCGALG